MMQITKFLKVIGLIIVGIIFFAAVAITLFVNLSPQFGRGLSSDQKIEYASTGRFKKDEFLNDLPTVMDINYWKLIREVMASAPDRQPGKNVEVEQLDSLEIVNRAAEVTQLTWFGHSAFLLELDGKKILLDPMFGVSPSPHPWLGPKRYSKDLPIEIEQLPYIDAIILSHDHYDHLDYGSMQKLKDKVGAFYMPLGVGNHLLEWGVPGEKINELNWWETTMFGEIELVCTPARHFSGRGFFDRATTLWGSWVIKGKREKIFFSGDSGYGPHFKEIGAQYGPFDLSLMECGQYNEDWRLFHMMPEETVQAALDLDSKLMLPIHWGAFTLAFHDWTDPAERVTKTAAELNMPISTPKIGEPVIVGATEYPQERWWTKY